MKQKKRFMWQQQPKDRGIRRTKGDCHHDVAWGCLRLAQHHIEFSLPRTFPVAGFKKVK